MPLLVFGAGADEQRFPLFKNITRIGSSPTSDIALVDATVADDHGHILRKGDEYVVASLGRGRPVFVNGKKEKRAVLCDGDAVCVARLRQVKLLHDTICHTRRRSPRHTSRRARASFADGGSCGVSSRAGRARGDCRRRAAGARSRGAVL